MEHLLQGLYGVDARGQMSVVECPTPLLFIGLSVSAWSAVYHGRKRIFSSGLGLF